MSKKKQIIGYVFLMLLSAGFVFACLFLPLFYTKICEFHDGNVLVEGNFGFLEFVKQNIFYQVVNVGGNDYYVMDVFYSASGPMWLTVSTIYFNILTLIGSGILFVLSTIGLICAVFNKSFSFRNSAIYKTAGFVGGFAILVFIMQLVSFIVLTSLANGYISFSALYGCYINLVIGIGILVSSIFVKNKEGILKQSRVRDAIFFALSFACCVGLGFLLLTSKQFSIYLINEEFSTIYGLNQVANEFISGPVGGDVVFGISFYAMILVLFGLVFVAVYSIIGFIRVLMGKSSDWLSIRVKRWSRAVLDVFSMLFMILVCCCIILGLNIVLFDESVVISSFNVTTYFEFVLPFVLVILTRFVGVYNSKEVFGEKEK